MDKSWMKQSRLSDSYQQGVNLFLDFAFKNGSHERKIVCPCVKCCLISPVTRSIAFDHLICNGFMEGYTKWILHGETSSHAPQNIESTVSDTPTIDMQGVIHDVFGQNSRDDECEIENDDNLQGEEDEPNTKAKEFYNLIKDVETELYPGCTSFTKLSFVIELFHIKCMCGWSDNSFGKVLELFKRALGLNYEKIDACKNDCMLYRKEHVNDTECQVCSTPRSEAKVLRHFPLIPRLQRLFMSSKTSDFMTWHHQKDYVNDGCMRHPRDSPAWMTFDHKYKDFAADPRNVRLGLDSDGMNPFKTLSVSHNTWPVIMIPYNLPPWLCMKQPNFIMSLLIPGPEAPGNNIDVYLEPLIEELKILWEVGVETFDASTRKNFILRASLLWTISDFPAYANLSGWSTKGKYACPSCHQDTYSLWLKHSKKHCYMGHRRWLENNHSFRNDEKSFDGTKEKRLAPIPLSGSMILDKLEGYQIKFGKTVVNPQLPYSWKKRSIFFELPYWKDNLLRHNLDVMHIEKNVCESLVGTLLSLDTKYKDNLNSRLDLKFMGIRSELHPKESESKRTVIPPACFTLTKKEKTIFCRFLKTIKVPDGYAANISRCVDVNQRKIHGLKSHDFHIIMTQLLPLALRGMSSLHVCQHITTLSNYFRMMYSKVAQPQDFMQLEQQISITLCNLEKLFPPSFFDIMVHLVIHLAYEARIAGPSVYRCMYPVERYLSKLKSYVRNKSKPEGCIAEGYLANKCLTFCSRYMEGVETKINRKPRNYSNPNPNRERLPIFQTTGRNLGKIVSETLDEDTKTKAHRYVLFNCNVVDSFIDDHRNIIAQQNPRQRVMTLDRIHSETFPSWFAQKAEELYDNQDNRLSKDLYYLAKGPNNIFNRFKRYLINGFRFHIKKIEEKLKTQNSGVIVTAKTQSFSSSRDPNPIFGDVTFFGILTDIIELDYCSGNRAVLFKCDWISSSGIKKEKDCTRVNLTKLIREDEPFILASQAEQVMYVEDLKHEGWHVSLKINPRDYYNMSVQSHNENVESYLQTEVCGASLDVDSEDISLVRKDMPDITVDTSVSFDANDMDEEA
ncbi:uncharacterized protein LOC133036989 [Cannabis sativa]|uniref:uncharacterized protein LOC133036989 n=1 Tax=Cannabis sativa TaxID=3483 RepID=UPI0029CA5B13|nr:uncharacterized protein LOC133036989 [Cannabis sativa]